MLVGYQELYDKIVELKEASQKSHTLIAKRYRHAKSLTQYGGENEHNGIEERIGLPAVP